MRTHSWTVAVIAMAVLTGCHEQAVIDGGDLASDGKYRYVPKADCPDCDVEGPSAFVQTKLGSRWYQLGDRWHVAFQFRTRTEYSRLEFIKPTKDTKWVNSPLYLFEYEVVGAGTVDYLTQSGMPLVRDTVSITVRQVDPHLVGFKESTIARNRLDDHEYGVRFRMDDLTNALDVTYFNRNYPNGKTVAASSKYSFSSSSTLFPVNVPRLLVNADTVMLSGKDLAPDLVKLADQLDSTWRDRSYRRYTFRNGDTVYWAEGYQWPFYIENEQGTGLLLNGYVGQ